MKNGRDYALSRREALIAAVSFAAFPSAALAQAQPAAEPPRLDVPYVPTPQSVVDRMLELADIKKDSFLIDLGSGDGRIAITAAKKYGIKTLGVDINPVRIAEAKANAAKAGVTQLVEFRQQNLFETDISQADVLTMYLLPSVNLRLRPRILKEMKPGTRIVSHAFDMGDWKPEKHETVDGRNVYLWTVPAR